MYKIFVKNNNSQDDKKMISLLSEKMSFIILFLSESFLTWRYMGKMPSQIFNIILYKDPRHCANSCQCTAPNAAMGTEPITDYNEFWTLHTTHSLTSIHPARELDTWTLGRTHQWWLGAAYTHSLVECASDTLSPYPSGYHSASWSRIHEFCGSCNCPGPHQPFT